MLINEDITDLYKRFKGGIKREEESNAIFNEFIERHNIVHGTYRKTDRGVDFDCDIIIKYNDLINGELPFKFGSIAGDFDCSETGLKTLKNSPYYVYGSYIVGDTLITSLEYSPEEVGTFGCTGCDDLENLEYLTPKIRNILNTKGTEVSVNDIPDECEIGQKIVMNDFKWARKKDNCDWKEKRDNLK